MNEFTAYLQENIWLFVIMIVLVVLIVATVGMMIIVGCAKRKKAKLAAQASEASEDAPQAEEPETEPKAETEETPAEEPIAETEETPAEEPIAETEETPAEEPAAEIQKEETTKEMKEETPTEKTADKKRTFDGKWRISETEYGTFRFELLASNGEKLLGSNDYSTLNGAKRGIETYKANLATNNVRVVSTKGGDFLFHLLNKNGQMLTVSESYKKKANCENALASTVRFAATAKIEFLPSPAEEEAEVEEVEGSGIVPSEEVVSEELVYAAATPTSTEKKTAYDGKWIIRPTEYGTFRFELRASNGEKLLGSNDYTTENGARKGIETYKFNIANNHFRIVSTKNGDYLFQLLNKNGQILTVGESYDSKARCESAMKSTIRFAASAYLDLSEPKEE